MAESIVLFSGNPYSTFQGVDNRGYQLRSVYDFYIKKYKTNFLKPTLSASVAFLMAIAVAFLIEKYGGAVGSVLGTVPSTIIPAIFIILSDSSKSVTDRVNSGLACVFGVFATNVCFMPIWKVLPPRLPKKWSNGLSVLVSTIVSLMVWFVAAIVVILIQQVLEKVGISMLVYTLILVILTCLIGGYLCWNLPPTPAGKNPVKWYIHIARGVVAAAAIFVSGVLSQTDAGIAAGAASTFPAIFLTTMVSVSLAQGADVSTGAIGPLILGGASGGWYTISAVVIFEWTQWNMWVVSLLAFVVVVVVWNLSVYKFVTWKRAVTARKTLELVESMSNEEELKVKVEAAMNAQSGKGAKEVEMKVMTEGGAAQTMSLNLGGDKEKQPNTENGMEFGEKADAWADREVVPPSETESSGMSNGNSMSPIVTENGTSAIALENGTSAIAPENSSEVPTNTEKPSVVKEGNSENAK